MPSGGISDPARKPWSHQARRLSGAVKIRFAPTFVGWCGGYDIKFSLHPKACSALRDLGNRSLTRTDASSASKLISYNLSITISLVSMSGCGINKLPIG